MPKPREEYLYILVSNHGYLAPLKMMGPVVRPIKVPKKIVCQLIMNGCTVYEYIPFSKETVKLTYENINDPHRLDGITVEVPEVKPVVDMTPPPEPVVEETKSEPEPIPVPEELENIQIPEVQPAPNVIERPDPQDYIFEYNEDGTVNESVIDWKSFTDKTERRAIRTRINEINRAAREKAEAEAAAAVEEVPEDTEAPVEE